MVFSLMEICRLSGSVCKHHEMNSTFTTIAMDNLSQSQ